MSLEVLRQVAQARWDAATAWLFAEDDDLDHGEKREGIPLKLWRALR